MFAPMRRYFLLNQQSTATSIYLYYLYYLYSFIRYNYPIITQCKYFNIYIHITFKCTYINIIAFYIFKQQCFIFLYVCYIINFNFIEVDTAAN